MGLNTLNTTVRYVDLNGNFLNYTALEAYTKQFKEIIKHPDRMLTIVT